MLIRIQPNTMGIPRQPLVPELKHGGVNGHSEGRPSELGAESKIEMGLVLDMHG
jgi:hypothetical protein